MTPSLTSTAWEIKTPTKTKTKKDTYTLQIIPAWVKRRRHTWYDFNCCPRDRFSKISLKFGGNVYTISPEFVTSMSPPVSEASVVRPLLAVVKSTPPRVAASLTDSLFCFPTAEVMASGGTSSLSLQEVMELLRLRSGDTRNRLRAFSKKLLYCGNRKQTASATSCNVTALDVSMPSEPMVFKCKHALFSVIINRYDATMMS